MREYIDFLSEQPPFDALDAEDLARLARHLEVEFVTAGSTVIEADGARLDHLYVVRKGAVDVVDRGRVVDQLGPGDVFGHLSVLSGLPPPLAVVATEDTLLYRLPDPRPIVRDPQRLRFSHYGSVAARSRVTRGGPIRDGLAPVSGYLRTPVWARPIDTIRTAAARITDAGQSCALVHTADGLGIVTDSDFRRGLADRSIGPDDPVGRIATAPALTVSADSPRAQAFVLMIEHGVHHLVAVSGTGRPVGVVRAIDLASADVRDPLLVRGAIESATSLAQLEDAARLLPSTAVELVDSGLPGERIGRLLSAVRDALLRKVVDLVPAAPDVPPPSWFVLGSTARFEPLPSSDMDTAIAWPDPEPGAPDPAAAHRRVAELVLQGMERCGLRRCEDGANATTKVFSRSVSSWEAAAARWQHDPYGDRTLLLTSMTADSRPVTRLVVGREVVERTRPRQSSHEFLTMMLRHTVATRPPVGFVRGFVVDHSGEHRGELDLKRRGLLPIASIGRWVAVVSGDSRGSTPDRLHRGAEAGILTPDEADSLVAAFEMIYELAFRRQIEAVRGGRSAAATTYLDPDTLDPLTRRQLRSVFHEVGRVQSRLENEWVARLPDGVRTWS